jgi:hypothetical protein
MQGRAAEDYRAWPEPILKRIRDGTSDVASKCFDCTYSPCSVGVARMIVTFVNLARSVGTVPFRLEDLLQRSTVSCFPAMQNNDRLHFQIFLEGT